VELRHYIEVLKRHRWLIVQGVVLVGIIAGLVSGMQTPAYRASARVLLRPGDASESLYPGAQNVSLFNDPDRYVSAQEDIIQSEAVAREAAKALGNAHADVLLDHVSVAQSGTTDVLQISGTDIDPTRARDIANAFAKAYIENRRLFAVSSLQKASDEIQGKLDQLQARIADLNAKIGDGGINPQDLQQVTGAGVNGPSVPTIAGPTGTALDDGVVASQEGLKAARYAAAVQYESLYSRQQEIQVDMSLKKGEAELIAEAKTPAAPFSPKPVKNGILGGFVGLLLAVGISFLHEQLDDRIRSREEAEKATGLPVLAELPADDEAERTPDELAAVVRPRSQLSEAIRGLRTSVEFLGLDEQVARLVVTSPGPGDGKSLVSANLAAAYAQAGHKVILVSADLRRPRLESIFGITGQVAGLTDVIARMSQAASAAATAGNGNGKSRVKAAVGGGTALDVATIDTTKLVTPALTRQRRQAITAALCTTSVPNLMLLPAGSPPPNPAELLGSRRVEQVLDDLNKMADVVIIDTPPVLAVTDSTILAAKSDGVLLVTSMRQTHRGGAQRAAETLENDHVRLLGVVLNRCETSSSYYGYGYGSYYGENKVADTGKGSRRERKAAAKAAKAAAVQAAAAKTAAVKAAAKAAKASKPKTSKP
jgi:Mrp family chromosome partitioning ATPase/capsular polysaccharide biosynthesis protein